MNDMRNSPVRKCATSNVSNEIGSTIIDSKCYEIIRKTVSCSLRKNAGGWITEDEIKDVVQSVALHILLQVERYDKNKGAFSTWCSTIAHNYSIQLGKRMKKAGERAVRLSCVNTFLEGMDDDEKALFSTRNRQEDTSLSWAMDNLGLHPEETEADFFMMKALEENERLHRKNNLQEFLETSLTLGEKQMLEMIKNNLSKEEMMAITHKTGGSIDVCKSRLRAKVYNWMKASDYYGER